VLDLSGVLPAPTDELRWPLAPSVHAALEPHLAIADALALPGVSWLDLCARGVHHRHLSTGHELVEYLAAWCDVADHHAEAAIEKLERLRGATVSGMTSAISLDLASVLADLNDLDKARALIAQGHIRDPGTLDVLAAMYYEVSRSESSIEINQLAIEVDDRPTPASRCHRLARQVVLGSDRELARASLDLAASPVGNHLPDPTCAQLAHELDCWVEPRDLCAPYLHDRHLPAEAAALLAAYFAWPTEPTRYPRWRWIIREAERAVPLPGGEVLALRALTAAGDTTQCDREELQDLWRVASRIHADPRRDRALDVELASVQARLYDLGVGDYARCVAGVSH
jgi:hypothetical protein